MKTRITLSMAALRPAPVAVLKTIILALWISVPLLACTASDPTATPIPAGGSEVTFAPSDPTPAVDTAVSPTADAPVQPSVLTRDQLKNAAYPNEWPADGVAQLENGEYREKYTPDSATELTVRLSHLVVFGDLDGDGAEDAAVIVVVDPGGSGTFFYLAAVLNQDGTANPVASHLLGDRVFIRSMNVENGEIVLELDSAGPDDPVCCPTDNKRLTLRLDGTQLVETDVVDLPDPEVAARFGNPPQRIEFTPGTATASLQDRIIFNGINSYLVGASAGQTMTVTLISPHNDVWLSIRGYDGGLVLHSIQAESSSWSGKVPATQDYLINAVAAGGATPYQVDVEIAGAGEAPAVAPAEAVIHTPANIRQGPGTEYDIVGGADAGDRYPVTGRNGDASWWRIALEEGEGWVYGELVTTSHIDAVAEVADVPPQPAPSVAMPTPLAATRAPEEGQVPPVSGASRHVLYITFDDGPTAPQWTPQVLEVLSRYNAKGTFFVLGQLAQAYPEMIQAQANTGHTVASHTYDHRTLDGIGREAFFQEIQSTEQALGGVVAKCLRPPYGATDAYTRAYAEELGYELVMWDIDTRDWSRPGADVIASIATTEVFPGAVVLFHDGGGDRSQTVAALETILNMLSNEGYVFEVICQ